VLWNSQALKVSIILLHNILIKHLERLRAFCLLVLIKVNRMNRPKDVTNFTRYLLGYLIPVKRQKCQQKLVKLLTRICTAFWSNIYSCKLNPKLKFRFFIFLQSADWIQFGAINIISNNLYLRMFQSSIIFILNWILNVVLIVENIGNNSQ
jgi:hypothetical protein